jgi:WD40 repeat protein
MQGGGRVWDLAADEPAETGIDLPNDGKAIEMATFSSDGRWLVTAGGDAAIQIWDLTSAPLQLSPQSLTGSWDITGLALSRDGRWLAATSGSANIQVWDLRADEPGKEVRELSSPVLRTDMIAISPDSRWLVAAMTQPTRHLRPTTVALWDLHAEPFRVPMGRS